MSIPTSPVALRQSWRRLGPPRGIWRSKCTRGLRAKGEKPRSRCALGVPGPTHCWFNTYRRPTVVSTVNRNPPPPTLISLIPCSSQRLGPCSGPRRRHFWPRIPCSGWRPGHLSSGHLPTHKPTLTHSSGTRHARKTMLRLQARLQELQFLCLVLIKRTCMKVGRFSHYVTFPVSPVG